ncbi:MAG: RNA polymerase sigma factor [Anaerolineae bacterium]|nr:RNA polymerase sigma factor [Anaerolineae bacterium]
MNDEDVLYRDSDNGGDCNVGTGESELIQQLQQGDLKALGVLYEENKGMVYHTALAITHDERAAEDILQECFVRLNTYAKSVDSSRPLRPWLYRVTVNLSYDWSSKRRWSKPLEDVIEWLSGIPGSFPAPDHSAEEKETVHLVREVIADLPHSHKTVIVLFYMENQKVEDIAEILELPVGTVKSRLHYARKRLREALTQRQRPVPEMAYEFT